MREAEGCRRSEGRSETRWFDVGEKGGTKTEGESLKRAKGLTGKDEKEKGESDRLRNSRRSQEVKGGR